MAKNIEIKLSLISEKEVMNGFCFSFCLCLLNKLKRLRAEGRTFNQNSIILTPIAHATLEHLTLQLHYNPDIYNNKELDDFIRVAEEFLEIFVAYPAPFSPSPSL